jgi:hypothetical protein
MTSSTVDSYLDLIESGGSAILASNDNIDGTTQDARLTFTATSTDYYFFRARSASGGATGAYTLATQ